MRKWFESQAHLLESETQPGESDPLAAWHWEVSERILPVASQGRNGLGPVLYRIWSILHRDDPRAVLPHGSDPIWLPPETERLIELRQLGDRLIARQARRDGSPLALIRTRRAHQDRAGRRLLGGRRRAGMGRWLGKR